MSLVSSPLLDSKNLTFILNDKPSHFKVKYLVLKGPDGQEIKIDPTRIIRFIWDNKPINGFKQKRIVFYQETSTESPEDRPDTHVFNEKRWIRRICPEISEEEIDKMDVQQKQKLYEKIDHLYDEKREKESLSYHTEKENIEQVKTLRQKKAKEWNEWEWRVLVRGSGIFIILYVVDKIYSLYLKKDYTFFSWMISSVKKRIWEQKQ